MNNNIAVNAPAELVEQTLQGPHKGWDTFDAQLEGARFHQLHELASAEEFDTIKVEQLITELESLSQSNGYALADSYLFTLGDGPETPWTESMKEELFDNEGSDLDYFCEVRNSCALISKVAKTDEARALFPGLFNSPLEARMKKAFTVGRDLRQAQEATSSPAP